MAFASTENQGSGDVPRDRYGRYLLPRLNRPGGPLGMSVPWTRVSTILSATEDTYGLTQWKLRLLTKGLSIRPDLYALAAATSLSDTSGLRRIVESALEAGGSAHAANTGTALHKLIEEVDAGHVDIGQLPEPHRADVAAYRQKMQDLGIEVLASEIRVVLPEYVIGNAAGVAGTADLVVRYEGQVMIADVKTGADPLKYGSAKIAQQLWAYANAEVQWDPRTETYRDMPEGLKKDIGLLIHVPAGKASAEIHYVDLSEGQEMFELGVSVLRSRKRKIATGKLEARPTWADRISGPEPTWADQISKAQTGAELKKIRQSARSGGEWSDSLRTLALERMAEIREQAQAETTSSEKS